MVKPNIIETISMVMRANTRPVVFEGVPNPTLFVSTFLHLPVFFSLARHMHRIKLSLSHFSGKNSQEYLLNWEYFS